MHHFLGVLLRCSTQGDGGTGARCAAQHGAHEARQQLTAQRSVSQDLRQLHCSLGDLPTLPLIQLC